LKENKQHFVGGEGRNNENDSMLGRHRQNTD